MSSTMLRDQTDYQRRVDRFFNSAMSSGTPLGSQPIADYVLLSIDRIVDYERTILELRQQLIHYRNLLAVKPKTREPEYMESATLEALNPASTALLNAILEVRIPQSAVFTEYEEGEL
jgi:hypothetical protein